MNRKAPSQEGFTLVELIVSMTILAVIMLTFLVFFKSALFDYVDLQTDATNQTELTTEDERIANVVRGLTSINSATANNLSIYAYFDPNDQYVSLVNYYLQKSGSVTQLLVSVTPMTANPPIGTPITGEAKTYTIMDDFYEPSGGSLFTYLDNSDNQLTLPISNLDDIDSIGISLATPLANGGNQAIPVQVSLRNRDTN